MNIEQAIAGIQAGGYTNNEVGTIKGHLAIYSNENGRHLIALEEGKRFTVREIFLAQNGTYRLQRWALAGCVDANLYSLEEACAQYTDTFGGKITDIMAFEAPLLID